MEISSPGLDRPLKKEKDFVQKHWQTGRNQNLPANRETEEFCGELTAYDNNSVTIDEEGTPHTFDKKRHCTGASGD